MFWVMLGCVIYEAIPEEVFVSRTFSAKRLCQRILLPQRFVSVYVTAINRVVRCKIYGRGGSAGTSAWRAEETLEGA
jgi:hypothetical protein